MNYYNYFTEIEEHFVMRRGKNLTVSPLDWRLIAEWQTAGVPLNVALRGIDTAMDSYFSRPRRSSEKLSTLVYCHDAVMEEFERFKEAHVGASQVSEDGSAASGDSKRAEGPDPSALLAFLQERMAEIESLSAKHSFAEGISRALERLGGIAAEAARQNSLDFESVERDLALADQLLVAELRQAAPEEQLAEWEREAKAELKVYRKKLPKDTYAKILDNYLAGKVRRFFNVGEMSLFQI
jgi:hypothetical protein